MTNHYEAPKVVRMTRLARGAGANCNPGSGASTFCVSVGSGATNDCQLAGLSPSGDCDPVGFGI